MQNAMRRAPESIAGWRNSDFPVISSASLQSQSNGFYLLAGAIAVGATQLLGPGPISSERYYSKRFAIKVYYPDGTVSTSPQLTLNSGRLQNKQEMALEDILLLQPNGHPLDNCLIGINLERGKGSVTVRYILIPDVVEAVIKNRIVTELVDYRSQSAQKAT